VYAVEGEGYLHEVVAPAAWDPDDLARALEGHAPVVMAGDGADLVPLCAGCRRAAPGALDRVRAADLVARVRAGGPLPVAPQYLRLPDAEENRLRREREAAAT